MLFLSECVIRTKVTHSLLFMTPVNRFGYYFPLFKEYISTPFLSNKLALTEINTYLHFM